MPQKCENMCESGKINLIRSDWLEESGYLAFTFILCAAMFPKQYMSVWVFIIAHKGVWGIFFFWKEIVPQKGSGQIFMEQKSDFII